MKVRAQLANLTPSSRTAAALLVGAALVASLGGAALYKASEKTVLLSVDGQVRPVRSHSATVGDVLAAAGLRVREHDLLAPGADEKVADGGSVSLRRGRSLELTVDGAERTVWVTAASVDEALLQLGIGDSRSVLSASRSRQIGLDGLTLDVRLAKRVDLIADGRSRGVITTAPTVKDLLAEAGVGMRPTDKVSVPLDRRPVEGMLVRITRVDAKSRVENVAIDFPTEPRDDASMYKGESKILRDGRPGVVVKTFALTFVDGRLAKEALVSQITTASPVPRIVAYGTAARPAPQAPAPQAPASSGGLNWGALAGCESGGDPRAVSSGGAYRGLYQFSIGTWQGVGGSGDPIDASSCEQTYRASVLYSRSGRSSWPVCGRYL